jgi:hypothetical protein
VNPVSAKVEFDFDAIAKMVKRLNVERALNMIRDGNKAEALETAKWLIGHHRQVRVGALMKIAKDNRCGTWNRIAAVYTVGFLRRRPNVAPGLIALLADRTLDVDIRGHTAEAIGYYRAKAAIPLLRKILLSSESPGLKVECIFALARMWEWSDDFKTFNSGARKALNEFARTQPTGKAAKELRQALRDIRDGVF